MSKAEKDEGTVVVGAMHRTKEGGMFSVCVYCGAMAEQLVRPCPEYMKEAATMMKTLEPK